MTPPKSDATGMSGFFRAEAALFGKVKRGEWQAKGYFYNSERGYPGAAVKVITVFHY